MLKPKTNNAILCFNISKNIIIFSREAMVNVVESTAEECNNEHGKIPATLVAFSIIPRIVCIINSWPHSS